MSDDDDDDEEERLIVSREDRGRVSTRQLR